MGLDMPIGHGIVDGLCCGYKPYAVRGAAVLPWVHCMLLVKSHLSTL